MTTDIALTTASAFEIRELTGAQRHVVLTARALPYRPFTLEGTQRSELTWLPGSPEATQTVLGAQEEPTTIEGFWKDLYLASGSGGMGGTQLVPIVVDGVQVTTAKDIAKIVDSIRRQGQQVIVTWDEETRRGILKSFRKEWHNVHDLKWSITFEWTDQGEPTAPTAIDGGTTTDAASQMSAQQQTLDSLAVPSFPVPLNFQTTLINALQQADTAVANAVNATSVQATGATSPDDATRRTFASTNDVVNGVTEVVATYDAQPARALVPGGSPNAPVIGQLTLGQIVQAESYVRAAQRQARILGRTAAIARATIARQLDNDLIGVWQAGDGEDLRDVALQFYGSKLQWRTLLTFNELSSTALTRGQLVLVPRAPANTTVAGT